jgi:hypothetical protein
LQTSNADLGWPFRASQPFKWHVAILKNQRPILWAFLADASDVGLITFTRFSSLEGGETERSRLGPEIGKSTGEQIQCFPYCNTRF